MNPLIPFSQNTLLLPSEGNKDTLSRLSKYLAWLDDTNSRWFAPDLAAYRDTLLAQGLSPNSVASHLSTIRGRYQSLLLDRDLFYQLVPSAYAGDIVSQKAWVDELISRIENALKPQAAPVTRASKQDVANSEHIRLTSNQASELLARPNPKTLNGLRDLALIATLLCTGLREGEAAKLQVSDLRQSLSGELAVLVREGKGAKQRLFDNIFIERFWRSLKYELIYLNAYETGLDLVAGLATYIDFYNHRRPHQSLAYQTPAQVYFQSHQPTFNP